jgi:hypothetical protein
MGRKVSVDPLIRSSQVTALGKHKDGLPNQQFDRLEHVSKDAAFC